MPHADQEIPRELPARSAAGRAGHLSPGGRLASYVSLTRLDKPIGILLLLWPTLDALWIAAAGWPGWRLLLIFTAGTVLMRSAGCAINDVADRNFDAHVQRTAGRVLARGALSTREAVLAALVLAALAALSLPLMNAAAGRLAVVAVAVAASYPYFKRFFPLPQAYLGIAFSFGIPMAFAAVQGSVPLHGWLLFGANLFWVVAYDTEYAMVDRRDDLRIGLRSSAIFFGRADVLAVAVCYGLYLGALAGIGRSVGLDGHFAAGWAVALACAVLHVWWIRQRDPAQCFRAFRHNHWLGLAVFAGIVLDLAYS
jgi:4-hydroxybenzoate polyprenyltransferase